ncbi:TIGR02217 family protein [Faunimonas pinastri]|uniref:TIGR02217 family protein n=1 Tax=Faunimonas pinastri TaxID=1855383 RepID=A0A1H9F4P6_9HYPH|nr:DUF2460 domain-containing protein [Faunimonas pinastri]SEQ32920.1 TIGR02217 family protein [Faunimonas pinastri]
MASFHEVSFPFRVSNGSSGGPERKTEIVDLNDGREERNASWSNSRRKYNVTKGLRTADDLYDLHVFFEERRGRLYGFRFKDITDFQSTRPGQKPTALDQPIGTGDGATKSFQLVKVYGAKFAPWTRKITKPVAGSVSVAVGGGDRSSGWTVDATTGLLTFDAAPANGVAITAGFEFDVPVRFNSDTLDATLASWRAGTLPDIELIEIRL